jgi:hypothetical protein
VEEEFKNDKLADKSERVYVDAAGAKKRSQPRNVRLFNGLSEKEPEIWTDGSEVLGWREGEVELQATG